MATIEKRVDSTGCTTYRVKVRMKGYSESKKVPLNIKR